MTWSLEIHHIDVTGSGDATLIVAREVGLLNIVRAVLIDGGRAQYADDVHQYLCKVLQKNPVAKEYHPLHAIVVTHYDSDHVGGIMRLLQMPETNLYSKARIYDQGEIKGTGDEKTAYTTYCKALGSRQRCSADKHPLLGQDILWMDEIRLPDTPQVMCVAANCEVITGYDKNRKPIIKTAAKSTLKASSNERSLAFLVRWHNFTYYVGGDIEEVQEDALCTGLNVSDTAQGRVLALKTSHHGANTATSRTFVNRLRPAAAFISCGTSNMYQHPAQQTINVLDGYEAMLYPTHEDGRHPETPPDPPYRPLRHYMTGYQDPDEATDPIHGHLGGAEAIIAGDPGKEPGHILLKVTEQQARHTPVTGRVFASVKAAIAHTAQAGGIQKEVAIHAGEMAGEVALVSNAAVVATTTLFALNHPGKNIAPTALIGARTGASVLADWVATITSDIYSTADKTLMGCIKGGKSHEEYARLIFENTRKSFVQQLSVCLSETDASKFIREDQCKGAVEAILDPDKVLALIEPALQRGPDVDKALHQVIENGKKVLEVKLPSSRQVTKLENDSLSKNDLYAITSFGEALRLVEEVRGVELDKGFEKIEKAQKSKNLSSLEDTITSAVNLIANGLEKVNSVIGGNAAMLALIEGIQSDPLKKKVKGLVGVYLKDIDIFQATLEGAKIAAQALQRHVNTFTKHAQEALFQIARPVNCVVATYLLPVAVKAGRDSYASVSSITDQALLLATATATAFASAADVAIAGGADQKLLLEIAHETIGVLLKEDKPVSISSFDDLLQRVTQMVMTVIASHMSLKQQIAQNPKGSITPFIGKIIPLLARPEAQRFQDAAAIAAATSAIFRAANTDVEQVVTSALQSIDTVQSSESLAKAGSIGKAARQEVEHEQHDSSFTVEFYDVTAQPGFRKAVIHQW